jgi:hypothetical protein
VKQPSNAHTLDWDGNAWYQGDVYVGSSSGTDKDEGSKKLATEEYVEAATGDAIKNLSDSLSTVATSGDYNDLANKPEKGIDYFTPEVVQEIAEQAAKLVEVPSGGIDVTGAEVGQIIKVAEVDEDGRPIAWMVADSAGGVKKARLVSCGTLDKENLPEYIEITTDMDGKPFSMREFVIIDDFQSEVSYKCLGLNADGGAQHLQMNNGRTTAHVYVGDNFFHMNATGARDGNFKYSKADFPSTVLPNAAWTYLPDDIFKPVEYIAYPSDYRLAKGTF